MVCYYRGALYWTNFVEESDIRSCSLIYAWLTITNKNGVDDQLVFSCLNTRKFLQHLAVHLKSHIHDVPAGFVNNLITAWHYTLLTSSWTVTELTICLKVMLKCKFRDLWNDKLHVKTRSARLVQNWNCGIVQKTKITIWLVKFQKQQTLIGWNKYMVANEALCSVPINSKYVMIVINVLLDKYELLYIFVLKLSLSAIFENIQ